MSDFAYSYFNTELDKLDIPDLESIFEKVQKLLAKRRSATDEGIDREEVERINAVYAKIPREEQIGAAHAACGAQGQCAASQKDNETAV